VEDCKDHSNVGMIYGICAVELADGSDKILISGTDQ
jgi:hypothetical protein